MSFFLSGHFKKFLLLVIVFNLPMSAYGAGNSSETPVARLVAKLSGFNNFHAKFTQYVTNKSGVRIQNSRGVIKVQRPGKFYWHTLPPIEQVIVSDGKHITVYDPDLEQATIQPVSKDIASTPALLLSGDVANISSHYDVAYQKAGDIQVFLLTPKKPDALFESLQLRFKHGSLIEMRMADSLGQKSVVAFDKVLLNASFKPDAFQLKLPKGTDVIRDRPR